MIGYLGLPIHVSDFCPEFGEPEALPDAEERLHAMTLHHIDLSLLDITSRDPVVFQLSDMFVMHPNNLARLRASTAPGYASVSLA